MPQPAAKPGTTFSNLLRSVLAVAAGILVGGILSIATDALFHALGITPALGAHWSDRELLLATSYRILYSIASAWLTAWLAPANPMKHALILGYIAFFFSAIGAASTWSAADDPHWYSVTIALIAVPSAWLGGKLYLRQRHQPA